MSRREGDGGEEVLTLCNEYIIPIPDPKPEDLFAGAGVASSESPVRYAAAPVGVFTRRTDAAAHSRPRCVRMNGLGGQGEMGDVVCLKKKKNHFFSASPPTQPDVRVWKQ